MPPTLPPADFRRRPFWKRWFGQRSERAAAQFLRKLGYRILAANVSDRRGELDLLVLDKRTLVVVEVRSTSTDDPHRAAASVDRAKQKRLTDATRRFLSRRRLLGTDLRFDVIAIAWPPDRREPTILHLPNAFEATGKFQMLL